MKKIMVILLVSLLMLTATGLFARNITLRNNGSTTLTIRYSGSSGSASWTIGPGGSAVHSVPDGTSAMRYWADTGANAPPCNTLAEFTLNGAGNLDFYDVSLVDGFNVASQIVPSGGSGDGSYYSCGIAGCTSTALLTGCPSELRSQGACCSACMIFGSPQYCCSGAYNTPATCPPTSYSNWFKSTCPDAYSYAYDDTTSTYTCTGASYTINWAGAGSTGGGGTTATPTPTPATGGGGGTSGSVTAYQHCDYGGWSSGLGVGAYDLDLLQNNMGFRNDDMSSVRISSGYEVTMYWDHHFLGSTLTKTGDDNCLVNEGWNDQVSSIKVARKFEAEAWVAMSGVQTEGCSEGGSNVGWIDAGDWIAYPSAYYHAGTFIIEYRVASLNGGGTVSADLNGGSIQLGSRSIPSTGGWQNWTTVTQTVNIPEGTYALGIYASAGGWNVNWIRVRPQ